VNALFSLGHTLLATQALGRVEAAGLDAWQGFLHVPVSGRPALALDIMEPLRPWVELFVLDLLDTALSPEDFRCSEGEGCRLDKDARGRFYAAWSEWSRAVPADGHFHGTGLRTLLTRRVRDLRRQLLASGTDTPAPEPQDASPDAPY
jgi:CRISPR-associated protein Cas1